MNFVIKLFWLITLITISMGCDEVSNQMDPNFPGESTLKYKLRRVLQYDPININGINIRNELDFFESVRFDIFYKDNSIYRVLFDNGNVPFSPFEFESESVIDVECELDQNVSPYELRIKGTNKVIAYFLDGEFVIPFQLGCSQLNYKYTFSSVK